MQNYPTNNNHNHQQNNSMMENNNQKMKKTSMFGIWVPIVIAIVLLLILLGWWTASKLKMNLQKDCDPLQKEENLKLATTTQNTFMWAFILPIVVSIIAYLIFISRLRMIKKKEKVVSPAVNENENHNKYNKHSSHNGPTSFGYGNNGGALFCEPVATNLPY